MQFQRIVVKNDEKIRLDVFLSEKLKISRSFVQKLVEEGNIKLNRENPKKAGVILKNGDEVAYRIPENADIGLKAEKIKLDVIFEDKDMIVINKDPGIVVHPDISGHQTGTIVNAIMAHSKDLSGISGENRPGIVHRLDKDTSGILMIAKNDESHKYLAGLFKDHKIKKYYLALVKGVPKTTKGIIRAGIKRGAGDRQKMAISKQGKLAVSSFEIMEIFHGVSLLKVNIETGRTHQIRVHMAGIGHPVVGDQTYGDKKLNKKFEEEFGLKRQFLHAKEISFDTKKFQAPLKADLEIILKKLRKAT
jgi:23S rRNA pseudouridine1911/1915/1917 synthase